MSFELGQMVQLVADPNREGSIIERLHPVGRINKYRVFHSAGQIQDYFEDQLTLSAQPLTSTDLASA